MITLYHHPGACSLAAHIILEEIGEPFTASRINLAAGEHQTPEYLAINPHGRVPALTDGDFVLTESPAILSWLGHRFPEAGLLDLADVNRLGRTHELLNFFSSSVHIAFAQLWRAARFADGEAAREEVMASGRRAIAAYFAEIEALVPDGSWLVGGRYSIADPYLLVFYRWGGRIGLDMTAYPGWTAHKQAMLARPAVQRALATEEIEVV
ncbi:MAG TPA: glutathione S-transferase N-terminal domain-containing protein [Allosphingosinicella sp.]|nr:glutathione S-transferase N-terminal domain-containing protein [Allosphingosinicella sp.]